MCLRDHLGSLLRLPAAWAKAPRKPNPNHDLEVGREVLGADPQGSQHVDRERRVVRVQGREDQVPGCGRTHHRGDRSRRAHLRDVDHPRRVSEHPPEDLLDPRVLLVGAADLVLHPQGMGVFDRVLDRLYRTLFGIDAGEHGVTRGGLAGSRRTGDDDES